MKLLEALYSTACLKKDAIILEDEVNGCISYKDFENATGKLYNYLLKFNFPKESIIAIRVKRSFRTYIAMVGALKAAIPYVIIGDASPKEYIDQVYNECEIVFTLDDDVLDEALKCEYLAGYKKRDNHDLAFVVYSTGSSGFFKGSMHEYGSLERVFNNSLKGLETHEASAKVLEKMSFFLLTGFYGIGAIIDFVDLVVYKTKMIIVKEENANDVDYLYDLANRKNVFTITASPKTLPYFINKPSSCIKEYFVSFEMFSCKYNPNYKIYNGYGSSESCGTICYKEIDKDYEIAPIGAPLNEMNVKLFNKDNKLTKANEIGELAFATEYFRGYIKHMDLFNDAYRDGYFYSGDLGFYNENNDIVIIGRKKDIKETTDGFIVPIFISNEIKKKFSDITNCYVKIFADEEPLMIVVYYISENTHSIEEINSKIKDSIKSYSLPTHAIKLDKFEYFYCGKINKNLYNKPEN